MAAVGMGWFGARVFMVILLRAGAWLPGQKEALTSPAVCPLMWSFGDKKDKIHLLHLSNKRDLRAGKSRKGRALEVARGRDFTA
ncbi:MAG: hypothetical protein RLY93_03790, partial [Sumerlaeia bacterium]